MGLLLERFVVDSEGSDCVEIDGNRGHLNISQMERLGKLFDFSILGEETTSVVVVPSSVSSFQVDVNICSSVSLGEFFQHLQFPSELSSLCFRS
jgi:hypothetical protein